MDEADNWAKWDAEHFTYYADRLIKAYREMGRLPYPCAARIRDVHEKLGEVIAELDEKRSAA